MSGVRLFVGGHAGTVQGEREDLAGDRCFSARHRPPSAAYADPAKVIGLLDSGAFSDQPADRLTPEGALARQFRFELKAAERWETESWHAYALVSYDLLIDEFWIDGMRHKRRWTVEAAEWAVRVTIEAAAYLNAERARVEPRRLVLACQGVDEMQYDECVAEVLRSARSHDWIGLGGWCILGRFTSWLPTFWATLYRVLPRIARAGVSHVHIFGVLYQPALGGLLWLADQHGLTVSTDSAAPVLNCTWKDKRKSGARRDYWRDNVAWWRDALAGLRSSTHYKQPPQTPRQASLWS
jgi:hypothetical protein